MKINSGFARLSRKLSFILVGSIALSSVGITHPQEWFKKTYKSAKETVGKAATQFGGAVTGKLKEFASATASRVKGGLSSAFDRVRRLGPAAVVSQLQSQVEKLGKKVGDMANCMIKQEKCSQTERVAFIATAVFVLALTAATVGVTLTVAATSKEVDSVVATTSEEVKGWGPQAVFQRLTNTVSNFKQSLASLRTGILKRQLTRGQKKFLYGTALSIAALVTIAIGVGVGSYVYAQKKQPELEVGQLIAQWGKIKTAIDRYINAVNQNIAKGTATQFGEIKALNQFLQTMDPQNLTVDEKTRIKTDLDALIGSGIKQGPVQHLLNTVMQTGMSLPYEDVEDSIKANLKRIPSIRISPKEVYKFLGLSNNAGRAKSLGEVQRIMQEKKNTLEKQNKYSADDLNILKRQLNWFFGTQRQKDLYDAYLQGPQAIQNLSVGSISEEAREKQQQEVMDLREALQEVGKKLK